MIFSPGNLLTLGIVCIILVLYRQFDKNNRSLDKVKRYAEKIRGDLDQFVDGKTQEMKNIGIELDVHQKTGREVLKRITQVEENLSSRASDFEKVNQRIAEYDTVLDNLNGMTAKVEENLKRIQNESSFVDTVAKRIQEAQKGIVTLEKALGGISTQFSSINQEQLKEVSAQVRKGTEEEVASLRQLLHKSQEMVRGLSEHLEELESNRQSLAKKTLDQLKGIEQQYAQNADSVRKKSLAALEQESEGVLKKLSQKADEIGKTTRSAVALLSSEIAGLEGLLAKKLAGFESQMSAVEESYKGALSEAAERGKKLEGEAFAALAERIEKRAEETERGLSAVLEEMNGEIASVKNALRDEIEESRKGLEEWRDGVSSDIERLSAEFSDHQDSLRDEILSWRGNVEGEMEEARTKFGADYEDFIGALQERMDKFAAEDLADRESGKREFESYLAESAGRIESFEKRMTEKIALLDSSIADKEERVERSLAEIDQRVKDFEGDVSYRFDSMGEIGNEIEDLERNLRLSMDQVSERIHGEYLRFEKKLAEERSGESARVAKEAERIRELMAALEKELNELKARAYDNVSEKLKMFEDEFFVDLKERSDSMDTSMEEWKKGVDQRMDELEEQNGLERSNIEKRYTDELRNRITELQNKIYGQYDKFEGQIAGYQERLQERMNLTDNSLKGFEEELKKEVSEIREQSRVFFEKEFTEHGANVNALLKKAERELEGELKALGEGLGEGTKELSALLEASRSDVTVWQAQVQQQFRQAEGQIQEEMAGFQTDVHATIDQLKKEFDFQKEDLILTTQDERTRLKNEIKQLGDAVVTLENDLRVRTESALEAFRGEWDAASMEFQKKTKDLALEADGRIKEYRASVKDTQEKVEALQKRLFGRIEEEYQVLSVNLAEIDKKQKGFVEQTKIFDRADSLKNTLEQNLEDLKAEVARVEAQGKELKELDRKFLQIKKLGDEVSAKLTRFLAEKRRIEEMEGDFKKLINISSATDVKLDQVTASHDTLQAIQARIRNLEEQEKEVMAKYERLENKKGILDTTIDGIDRGFQQLQTLEVGVKGIEESLSAVPQQIREVAAQIEQLAKGKDKAEAAVKTVQGLDLLLADLEQRTEKLQKAREWLAKTETRLEEINKQAQDQVKLLGSLLKEEGGREKKEKGAPTMSVREMVIRLARQGWDVNEIAQATRLSRGEVELILELGTKKS